MSKIKKENLHQKGGLATLKKYGKEYFSKLAKRRWRKERKNKKK